MSEARELDINCEVPELEYPEAVEAAACQNTTTWVTDNGRRVAAIVPVDVAEEHDRRIAEVMATPVSGPVADERTRVMQRLRALNAPNLAEEVGTSPDELRAWSRLLYFAEQGWKAR